INNGITAGTGANANVPVSGRITGITTDPNDGSTIVISTSDGGAWKTSNGGVTWFPLFDNSGGNVLPIFSGTITAGRNYGTYYLGTGEANNTADSYPGTGVWQTTDGGATWTQLLGRQGGATGFNPFTGKAVSQVVLDSGWNGTTNQIIYVADSDLVT